MATRQRPVTTGEPALAPHAACPVLSRRAMRPVSCPRAIYQRRQPEQAVLYRTVAAHLPAFLARTAGADGTGGWPRFVRREFEAYLKTARALGLSAE